MKADYHGAATRLGLRAFLLLAGIALAVMTWLAVARADEQALANEEEHRFSQLTYEVTNRLVQARNVLRGLQGLFQASDDVSRSDFHQYAKALGLGQGALGLQAIQFAPWVPHSQRAAFEARVRGDRSLQPEGYPGFRITPPGERPFYAPTEFNEPMAGNENAFGFDTAYSPVRAAALEAARDSGNPVASAPFTLVQAPGVGVVIRAAVYRNDRPAPRDTAERRALYAGQVSVVFLVDALLGGALGNHLGAQTQVKLTDLGPTSASVPPPRELLLGRYGMLPEPSFRHVEHQQSHIIEADGRFWQISMLARPLNPYLQAKSLMAGGLVLSLTLLVFAILTRTFAQRDRADARAAAVLDATLTPIITVDERGIIRSANRAASSLFGYSESQLLGQPFSALAPEAAAAMAQERATAGDGAHLLGTTRNFQGLTREGKWVPLAMSLSEVGRGSRRQFLASFHDMSAQQRIEEQQRAFAEELETTVKSRTAELVRVNQELESFAYSVAHDLRAPARHVHGFARLLETRYGGTLHDEASDYLGRIVRAADEMGRLIDDLLAFSRLGHLQLAHAPVDMNEVVAQCLRSVEGTPGSERIDWHIGPLPSVEGDAALLRLALSNLIGNAVKYSAGRDPARIEVFADETVPGEKRFCVKDNGVGFDMRYAHQLFQVFSRLHHSDEFEGTGVGLANVRRIVERHGGRVWALGEPGAGAQFWFALPAGAN